MKIIKRKIKGKVRKFYKAGELSYIEVGKSKTIKRIPEKDGYYWISSK